MLVGAFACAHTPQLLIRPDTEDRELVLRVHAAFARVKERLTALRPDVIAVVSGDHIEGFFLDAVPALAVYVGVECAGTFGLPAEVRRGGARPGTWPIPKPPCGRRGSRTTSRRRCAPAIATRWSVSALILTSCSWPSCGCGWSAAPPRSSTSRRFARFNPRGRPGGRSPARRRILAGARATSIAPASEETT